jgi:endonuclease G
LKFATTSAKPHQMVAAIGYPFEDDRNPLFVKAVYQDKFGVKRGAVGEIVESQGHLVSHDCSTLGGNSGSPMMALDTGDVVGLHFTGEFMYRNDAIAASDLAAFVQKESGNG